MAKIRGLLYMLISFAIFASGFYFLIIDYFVLGRSESSSIYVFTYLSIVIPILLIVLLITIIPFWIGYTMYSSPVPLRLDYEEAYQAAAAGVDNVSGKAE